MTETTRLVTSPGDKQLLTGRRTTDCRTALARAVAEYLRPLEYNQEGGRRVHLQMVSEAWSEPEDMAEFPSAVVYAYGDGTYDATNFTPSLHQLDGGVVLRSVAEFTIPIVIEVWCTDPEERMALGIMLEDALDPVDWMTGMRLELPHYFNSRATFLKQSAVYMDDGDDAQQRIRRLGVVLDATITQYVPLKAARPKLKVRTEVVVTDGTPVEPALPDHGSLAEILATETGWVLTTENWELLEV